MVRSGRGERLVFKGAEKRTQSRLKVGADLLTFAAGFLLGSMFGACVGALTIGLLRAAKRDEANSVSLDKPEDEVTQKANPSRIHDHRQGQSNQRQSAT
jgi:hypothetical protein